MNLQPQQPPQLSAPRPGRLIVAVIVLAAIVWLVRVVQTEDSNLALPRAGTLSKPSEFVHPEARESGARVHATGTDPHGQRISESGGAETGALWIRRVEAPIEASGERQAQIVDAEWIRTESKELETTRDTSELFLVRADQGPIYLIPGESLSDAHWSHWSPASDNAVSITFHPPLPQAFAEHHEIQADPWPRAGAELAEAWVRELPPGVLDGVPVHAFDLRPLSEPVLFTDLHTGVAHRLFVQPIEPHGVSGSRIEISETVFTPPAELVVHWTQARGVRMVAHGREDGEVYANPLHEEHKGASLFAHLVDGVAWRTSSTLEPGLYELFAVGDDWLSTPPYPQLRIEQPGSSSHEVVLETQDIDATELVFDASTLARESAISYWDPSQLALLGFPSATSLSGGPLPEMGFWRQKGRSLFLLGLPQSARILVRTRGASASFHVTPGERVEVQVPELRPMLFETGHKRAVRRSLEGKEGVCFLEQDIGAPFGIEHWVTIRFFNTAIEGYLDAAEWTFPFDAQGRYRRRVREADVSKVIPLGP